MADVLGLEMPVETGLELSAVVSLDDQQHARRCGFRRGEAIELVPHGELMVLDRSFVLRQFAQLLTGPA